MTSSDIIVQIVQLFNQIENKESQKELIEILKSILKGEKNNIIWKGNSIARLKKGYDYLNPLIEIIADDSLEVGLKSKLEFFLKDWFYRYTNEVLGDLINLKKVKIENQYLRALAFQLFENNGVLKRENVNDILKLIPENERKKLWGMGIKIGRYHVYLPKMLKPKAVSFRITLWSIYKGLLKDNGIPKFGLNFISDKKLDQKFLLLCGFEKFKEFFVRIDILEKLFIKILEKTKDRKFEVDSEMMNLLGCSKDNFLKLMLYMNYKKDKMANTYIFKGDKKNKLKKVQIKENPFSKLLTMKLSR